MEQPSPTWILDSILTKNMTLSMVMSFHKNFKKPLQIAKSVFLKQLKS